MKTSVKMTVARANEIQAEWMALDSSGPKSEITRVCRLMDECPKAYLSISPDGKLAAAMISGGPLCQGMPVQECWQHWGSKLNSEMAWQNCQWVDLKNFIK